MRVSIAYSAITLLNKHTIYPIDSTLKKDSHTLAPNCLSLLYAVFIGIIGGVDLNSCRAVVLLWENWNENETSLNIFFRRKRTHLKLGCCEHSTTEMTQKPAKVKTKSTESCAAVSFIVRGQLLENSNLPIQTETNVWITS